MNVMHQVMHSRAKQQASQSDDDEPRVKSVDPSEYFSMRTEMGLDRTHASQQHGSIQKSVAQRHALEVLVTPDADQQGPEQDSETDRGVRQSPTPREAERYAFSRSFGFCHELEDAEQV